jgi:S-adenosylmethionine synthetase
MSRRILVIPSCRTPIERCAVELCEHKGVGHPDTIVDGVCEAASRALSRAYLERNGAILHHNLDKGLLIAGQSAPHFGGGRILGPIRLIVCGRATRPAADFDVEHVVVEAARNHLAESLRADAALFRLEARIREGAANLKEVLARAATPLANDTSFGCGYAPLSRLERAVLELAAVLRSAEFRESFPAAGDDYKIMGRRAGEALAFTVALAFVDREVEDVAHYFALKRALGEYLAAQLGQPAAWQLNALDDPAARDESGLYLTVSGLSAEMGDDGQAGRGNRVNGLIAPGRVMSLEAAAGKNPVAHVGKLYNLFATLIAQDVRAECPEVEEVSVQLLSCIGAPVGEPELAALEVSGGALTPARRRRIEAIAAARLDDPAALTRLILDEKIALY